VLADVELAVVDGETLACVAGSAVLVMEAAGCGRGGPSNVLEGVGVIEGVNVSVAVAGAGDALGDGFSVDGGAGELVAV
jgi:hypothetical protein